MNKIKVLTIITFLSFLTVSCVHNNCQYTEIININNKESIILKKYDSQGSIYGIKIQGAGYINGEAKISLILNKGEYKTELIKGNIDFEWGGDWYSDTAEIIYTPINVQDGNIDLNYCFFD